VKGIVHAPSAKPKLKPESRDALLIAIVKARGWINDIQLGRIASIAEIAKREGQGDIIVLDEATSALDPKSQDALMQLLSDEMKSLTLISVGHRPELEQFHSRKLVLERRRGGAKLVSDITLLRRPGKPRLIRRWLKRKLKTAA
jgi:ABC-type sugar transport system ATPase subunit